MTRHTLRIIFEIGFALIIIATTIWGGILYSRWQEVLNRPLPYVIDTPIDSEARNQ